MVNMCLKFSSLLGSVFVLTLSLTAYGIPSSAVDIHTTIPSSMQKGSTVNVPISLSLNPESTEMRTLVVKDVSGCSPSLGISPSTLDIPASSTATQIFKLTAPLTDECGHKIQIQVNHDVSTITQAVEVVDQPVIGIEMYDVNSAPTTSVIQGAKLKVIFMAPNNWQGRTDPQIFSLLGEGIKAGDPKQCMLSPPSSKDPHPSPSCAITVTIDPAVEPGKHDIEIVSTSSKSSMVSMTTGIRTLNYWVRGQVWKSISTGYRHTCAIAGDGDAYCWGDGHSGQLGNGSGGGNMKTSLPVAVNTDAYDGESIQQISAGRYHTCAISDGRVYCWGDNGAGQLGNGKNTISNVPVRVAAGKGAYAGKSIQQISAGYQHTCAIASDDKAYCWGNGKIGQLGTGNYGSYSVPVAVDMVAYGGKSIQQISAGLFHTCAITSDGDAYCWGSGEYGRLGNGTETISNLPVAVDTDAYVGKSIQHISAGGFHTCAIASDGRVYCWGRNNYGQLGNGKNTKSTFPVAVSEGKGAYAGKIIDRISAGELHTCAIASDNHAYCWGKGGALGNGQRYNPSSSIPVPVAAMDGTYAGASFQSISAGYNHTCAIAIDTNAYCWGNNIDGQLGNGSKKNSDLPIEVHDPTVE